MMAKCKDCSFSSSIYSFIEEHKAKTNHELEYHPVKVEDGT